LNQVIWSKRSLAHLRYIRGYIEQFNPQAARDLAAVLVAAAESLKNFPIVEGWSLERTSASWCPSILTSSAIASSAIPSASCVSATPRVVRQIPDAPTAPLVEHFLV